MAYSRGLQNYLWANQVLFKDFGTHSQQVSARLDEASLRQARHLGREIHYLNSAQHRKEDIAREVAARNRIREGLICVLRSIDPCLSFDSRKNHPTRKLEIHYRQRKGIHLDHDQIHPVFGFMHARLQTWFPFRIYVCRTGRAWRARQMDQAKLHDVRRDNTVTWLDDVAQAQALFDQQLRAHWPSLLGGLAEALNPIHADLCARCPGRYYWSVDESAWASDVLFPSRAALQALYPRLVRYALTTVTAVDVLRFLGRPVPARGQVPHRCHHEISSNLKERVAGIRLKHGLKGNALKLYDKGSVLRAETLIRDPQDFKVYRAAEGHADGPKDWRPLRKGIADLHRRAAVSPAAKERYLEARAAVPETTPLRQRAEPLCRAVPEPARRPTATVAPEPVAAGSPPAAEPMSAGSCPAASAPAAEPTPAPEPARRPRPRRVRALNPLAADDAALLEAVRRHEVLLHGLRHRDLRRLLFGADPSDAAVRRRQAAAVTRKLRLLRGPGLLHQVATTHRDVVSEVGRRTLTALLAARNAAVEHLTGCAA